MKRTIAITMGDPGGVGPEIIAAAFKKKRNPRFQYRLFGIPAPFDLLAKKYRARMQGIEFVPVSAPDSFQIGKVSRDNAEAAYASLKAAAERAARTEVDAIVTAPLNKTTMRLMDREFHGHTEFLADAAGVSKFAMMFVSPKLKVTLATIHVPIFEVSRLIKKKLVLEKIELTHDFLKRHFRIKNPRLAVCALNPHGKETGTEDEAEIVPAVQAAQRMKISAVGPLSADQLFYDAYNGRFDAVISMYHDQGLAPFKMIAFRDGVNVTLGLPFIRTSPDHGTAFDIAYQGKADPVSFESALQLAEKLLCSPKSNSSKNTVSRSKGI